MSETADSEAEDARSSELQKKRREEAYTAGSNHAAVAEVCASNGISKQQFIDKAYETERLEVFQEFKFQPIVCQWFVGLRELWVLSMSAVSKIEGLEACPNIQIVTFGHCSINKIEGLQNCFSLEKLHLYGNNITKIEGLDSCTRLQTLWLHNNKIRRLEGLEKLTGLTELGLGCNRIEFLHKGLDANQNLTNLNLAANLFGSFQEILHLTRLPNLRQLQFGDPHFGECPVCHLANYQTYVLYNVPQITSLDALLVSNDTKKLAEATYMKKKMYYNMRIKTLKRNCSNALLSGRNIARQRIEKIRTSALQVTKQLAHFSRVIAEKKREHGSDATLESDAKRKFEALQAILSLQETHQRAFRQQYLAMRQQTMQVSKEMVSRLIVELETGGNIRLEDGKPTDVWYSSCVDLLNSRFVAEDFAPLGISGIRVRRVTRIHNRFLRNRFELRMRSIIAAQAQEKEQKEKKGDKGRGAAKGKEDSAEPGAASALNKRPLEYLFYGETPEVARVFGHGQEMLQCIQQGFRDPQDYYGAGLDGGIRLSNSLSVIDMPRVKSHFSAQVAAGTGARGAAAAAAARAALPKGEILIAKVFLGNCREYTLSRNGPVLKAENDASSDSSDSASPPLPSGDAGKGKCRLHSSMFEGQHSVFRVVSTGRAAPAVPAVEGSSSSGGGASSSTSHKQRVWHVFDPPVILPEYLVEFDYELEGSSTGADALAKATQEIGEGNDAKAAGLSPLRASEFGPFLNAMTCFRDDAFRTAARQLDGGSTELQCSRALEMGPPGGQWPALPFLAAASVLQQSGLKDMDTLVVLDLYGSGVKSLGDLSVCTRLRELRLKHNEIVKLEGLNRCPLLETLVVDFNLITRISEGVLPPTLRRLSMESNLLASLDALRPLRKDAKGLVALSVRHNPVCDAAKGYQQLLLQWLPSVSELDGDPVPPALQRWARQRGACTPDLLRACASTGRMLRSHFAAIISNGITRSARHAGSGLPSPKVALAGSAMDIGGGLIGVGTDWDEDDRSNEGQQLLPGASNDTWWASVVCVELERKGLMQLQHLERLVSLRRASFQGNLLTTVAGSGISKCKELAELCLECNALTTLDGLGELYRLRTLELGKNRLNSLSSLAGLSQLTQLSVEDNGLTTLAELTSLTNLMELYVGNNKILKLNEVQHLKALSKLIILDLSGNALTTDAQYRLYCIYHLRKLKVLDGIGVDGQELALARDTFSGKLTVEFLVEKLGHKRFAHIRELDLSSCRIRYIESLSGKDFSNLVELNLDNNLLTNLDGLENLEQLAVLRLNHNRLSSFQPNASAAAKPPHPAAAEGDAEPPPVAEWGFTAMRLHNLEVLHLGYNHIFDISTLGLHGLSALKVLYLEGNELTFLSGLEGCSQLQELSLDKNHIKHLDGTVLAALAHLRQLRIEENGLRTVTDMRLLKKLQVMHMGFNRISEFRELDELAELPSLTELNLSHNALSRKQLYRPQVLRRMHHLRLIDGKEVTIEERERVDSLFMSDRPSQSFILDRGYDKSQVGVITGTGFGGYNPSVTPVPVPAVAPSVSVLSIGLPDSSMMLSAKNAPWGVGHRHNAVAQVAGNSVDDLNSLVAMKQRMGIPMHRSKRPSGSMRDIHGAHIGTTHAMPFGLVGGSGRPRSNRNGGLLDDPHRRPSVGRRTGPHDQRKGSKMYGSDSRDRDVHEARRRWRQRFSRAKR